jgi:hypothetical protein
MAQSSLYKSGTSIASDVNVTDDPSRDLGSVDVQDVNNAVDVSDRSNRDLGEVVITNDPGVTGTVDVDLVAQSLAVLSTDLAAALASEASDEVRVTSPSPLDVSAATLDVSGAQVDVNLAAEGIDAATETTLDAVKLAAQATESALANEANVAHGRTSVTSAGTAEQMPSQVLEDGKPVALIGVRGNTGDVYIGDSSVTSSNGVPVASGQVITLQVTNLDAIYVDADNDGDELAYLAEVA